MACPQLSKPNNINSVTGGEVSAPNTITGITEPATSLSNARIGYNNLLAATTTAAAQVMLIPNTYERYKPGAGAKTVKYQLSQLSAVDFVGIAAHNAGSEGVSITVQYASTIGGALTTIDTINFSDNSANMLLFTEVQAAEIALVFTSTANLELGVIYAGKALEMQRPMYGGLSPIDLSGVTEYQSVDSDTGQFLGRTITRKGLESSFSWKHLADDWVRSDFMPFVESARKLPFFIKWRPDYYDSSVFGRSTADIKPANMGGGHRLMSVSFNMRGHQDI